ncbi:MAG: FAD-dependent oxidoreductase [Syntrophobacteraceae bacterium]|nr:FAD-dependent oxidoreductase [Syntrophobacteraceae bacterium]
MKDPRERLQKVCIIGATPAGIAAANKLGEMGIPVTLIDEAGDLNEKLASPAWKMDTGVGFNYAQRPGLLRIMRNPSARLILPASVKSIKHTPQGFSIRYTLAPTYIDSEKCTLCGLCWQVCPAIGPDGKKALRYGGRHALPGRPVIDKRRTPLCKANCPLGVNVQGYMALARAGRYVEALELIRKDNVLPGICGRICTHPCEAACRRSGVDQPLAIRDIKRFLADSASPRPFTHAAARTGAEKIAVIGSGPAGLAAASDLVRLGYRVTVFEKEKAPGGLLRYAIGPHRLPRAVLDREIDDLHKLGVQFHLGTEFKPENGEEFRAVVLATGLWEDRKVGAPGEELENVFGCLSYLCAVHRGEIKSAAGKTAVLGDGNSAFEAARTLARLGAEVTLISWFPEELIPADAHEVQAAAKEGIAIKTGLKAAEFVGANGKLNSIRFVPTVPGPPDANGIPWPVMVKGANPVEFEFERAVVAIGQTGNPADFSGYGEEFATSAGLIRVFENGRTRSAKVFGAGDATSGPSTVVTAMASGRAAARGVHRYLAGEVPGAEEVVLFKRRDDLDYPEISPEIASVGRIAMSERHPASRLQLTTEVELGFSEEQARSEASRCLQCGVCSECGECVEACSAAGAVFHADECTEEIEHAGVVILTDPASAPSVKGEDVIRTYSSKASQPDVYAMMLRGFAAAAETALLLGDGTARMKGGGILFSPPEPRLESELRIGVFVCRCNDSLGWDPELDRMLSYLPENLPVEYAESIPSACTREGAASIVKTIREKGLTRFVLASCVCCPQDLICGACTDQRSRLKAALFNGTGIPRAMAETCNLRGEALALLGSERTLAISRFEGLLRRSIQRAARLKSLPPPARKYNFTTAVIGESEAALRSALTLGQMGMEVFLFGGLDRPLSAAPAYPNVLAFPGSCARSLKGSVGDFQVIVSMEDGTHQVFTAGAVILGERSRKSLAYMPHPDMPPHEFEYTMQTSGRLGIPFFLPAATSIPGLLLASPPGINVSDRLKGTAAAMLAATIMPRGPRQNKGYTVSIDRDLCRGCGRCVKACPYRAISFHASLQPAGYAAVDEALCKGCGNCISICPSGAADSPYRDRRFLEQAIEEIVHK